MATTTTETRDAPARSFYLPASPSLSGGWAERGLTALYERHRRLVRRLE